jgi:hypothetical protein
MKNIHVLPTLQPSRLIKQKHDTIDRLCLADIATKRAEYKRFNLYITNDEEIGTDEYYFHLKNNEYYNSGRIEEADKDMKFWKKIIQTTDQDLIKEGVQPIYNEFLEWFVKNPSCEEVETESWSDNLNGIWLKKYHIIISEEESKQEDMITKIMQMDAKMAHDSLPKQETLEEAAIKYAEHNEFLSDRTFEFKRDKVAFICGAEWQQERSYSEEDMRKAYCRGYGAIVRSSLNDCFYEWFEQFKKK